MRMIPIAVFCSSLYAGSADNAGDAAAIMAKVAANMEKSAEARRQFVYRQSTRASLVRSGGEVSRRESREYAVIPEPKGTEKKLVSFSGQYRKGKAMIPYSEPGFKYKDEDIDGELLEDLVNDLMNDKGSRRRDSSGSVPAAHEGSACLQVLYEGQGPASRPAYL